MKNENGTQKKGTKRAKFGATEKAVMVIVVECYFCSRKAKRKQSNEQHVHPPRKKEWRVAVCEGFVVSFSCGTKLLDNSVWCLAPLYVVCFPYVSQCRRLIEELF